MFEKIIGHSAVKRFLEQSIATARVSHAYLFLGPGRVGKMTLARAFASILLNQEDKSLDTHPDVTVVKRIIDEKTDVLKQVITTEQMHGLRERLAQSALLPGWKIAMIEGAETMTIEGANALLKTLEEPRGKTIIILIAQDARFIPETIRSRCQVVRFGLVPRQELEAGLQSLGASKSEAEKISRLARGRPGEAVNMFKDPEVLTQRLQNLKDRSKLLGEPAYRRRQWIEKQVKNKKGEALHEEYALWREILRDALLCRLGIAELATNEMKNVTEERSANMTRALRRLAEAEDATRHHVDSRLALEHAICF